MEASLLVIEDDRDVPELSELNPLDENEDNSLDEDTCALLEQDEELEPEPEPDDSEPEPEPEPDESEPEPDDEEDEFESEPDDSEPDESEPDDEEDEFELASEFDESDPEEDDELESLLSEAAFSIIYLDDVASAAFIFS